MTTRQSVLVLGASGGCGQWATRLAREAGRRVRALVRPGTHFDAPEGVDVRVGSALDVEDLAAALEEQEVVISCTGRARLSVARTSPRGCSPSRRSPRRRTAPRCWGGGSRFSAAGVRPCSIAGQNSGNVILQPSVSEPRAEQPLDDVRAFAHQPPR